MNVRSHKIIAYSNNNELFCRECLGEYRITVTYNGDRVCTKYKHTHHCCSYGSGNNAWTEKYSFNNKIHKIILSSNICKLCGDECNHNNKVQDCEMALHFVTKYLSNINRIGINNIKDK